MIPSFKPPVNWNDIDDNISSITGIEYNHDNRLSYDIHWPAGSKPCEHPCLIWLHGGGFIGGSRTTTTGYCMMLANAGITVVNVDYGLAPRYQHPRQVQDVDNVIRHLQTLNEHIRPDLNRVFIGGDSAGAHIASEYAALITNGEYRSKLGLMLSKNVHISGLVLLCGLYDFMALKTSSWWRFPIKPLTKQLGWAITGNHSWHDARITKRMNVTDYITNDYPPCFIMDGNYCTFNTQLAVMNETLTEHAVKHVIIGFPRHKPADDSKDADYNVYMNVDKTGNRKLFHEFQFNMTKPESVLVYDDIIGFITACSDNK